MRRCSPLPRHQAGPKSSTARGSIPTHGDTERNAQGWFNHELQYYAATRPESARIEHGALVIEARYETLRTRRDWGGQAYGSAKLVTRTARGYGFYEVRAKLPCARGTWPAIWLLPSGGTWPDEGEIDMMEMVGWRPDSITIGIDDRAYMQVRNDQAGGKTAWPFTRPYNLILNLAIGGDWGGAKGVDDAALPQRVAVDYVRYWQRALQ